MGNAALDGNSPFIPFVPFILFFLSSLLISCEAHLTFHLSPFTFHFSPFTFHLSPLTFHFIINYAVVSPADFAVSLNLQNIIFLPYYTHKSLIGTMFATYTQIILATLVMYGKGNEIL